MGPEELQQQRFASVDQSKAFCHEVMSGPVNCTPSNQQDLASSDRASSEASGNVLFKGGAGLAGTVK